MHCHEVQIPVCRMALMVSVRVLWYSICTLLLTRVHIAMCRMVFMDVVRGFMMHHQQPRYAWLSVG